ncbi:MAG: hypothetical protein M5U27_00595 [Gaiella sp.]|nr:hypothetical protein [Gaiella sp.]
MLPLGTAARLLVLGLLAILVAGCATGSDGDASGGGESSLCSGERLAGEVRGLDDEYAPCDPYPEKSDGTESHEFEQEDIDAAMNASDDVWDYCYGDGNKSEAQFMGCLAHVDDVP